MVAALTNEQFIERARQVHGDRFSYERAGYTRSKKHVTVTCKIHGDYKVLAAVHLLGYACKKCAHEKIKGTKKPISSVEQFAKLIAKTNNQMVFDGAVCKTCNQTKRYVCNNSCFVCAKQHRKKSNAKWNDAKRKIYRQSNIFSKSVEVQNWIISIYKTKKEMQEQFGVKLNIDHIIPINGKNVCGLHVPWNMRITTEKFNKSKRNLIEDSVGCFVPGHVRIHESALPWNLKKDRENGNRLASIAN
jgi:hypothetical protein